jgi:hypothetical protein
MSRRSGGASTAPPVLPFVLLVALLPLLLLAVSAEQHKQGERASPLPIGRRSLGSHGWGTSVFSLSVCV